MSIQLDFGNLGSKGAKPPAASAGKFRLAFLGDFSGAANTGRLETGAALAGRKAIKVDSDNIDKVLQRLKPKLTLNLAGGAVEVPIGSMDDFHPEQLYSNLEVFSELAGLRQRLKTSSTFAKAAAELQSWAGQTAQPATPQFARGSLLPSEADLDDFAKLLGKPTVAEPDATPIDELIKQIVAPHIVAAKDPRQDAMVATVDEALSSAMRGVLHHPDFQTLEALWRSVDLLTRTLETGPQLEVVLFDVTAEELAADLCNVESLEASGLYSLLAEQPMSDATQGAFSVIIGGYTFARTRAHAELLARVAKVAADAQASFIAAISPAVLDENPKDIAPEIQEAWKALGALPDAAYLGLAAPGFMLRQPYGKKSDPVDCFAFEEITAKTGLTGFLWGNPALVSGLLLGRTFAEQGKKMNPGSIMTMGDMPFYYYTDKDGDQVAMPTTEKLVTTAHAALLTSQGFMPLVSMKGSPEIRLGSFNSLAGKPVAGFWAPVTISRAPAAGVAPPAPPPPPPAAEVPAPAPAEAAPAPAPEAPPAAEAPLESTGDPDLDALLASVASPEPAGGAAAAPASEAPPEDMDPDLAELLKGL